MPALMICAAPPDEAAPVTRTGGRPLAPPGFAWPSCAGCGQPMQFLAQARLRDADPAFPDRLLLIFMCRVGPDCETWDATAGANRAACVPVQGAVPHDAPPGAAAAARAIDGVALVPFEVDPAATFDGASYDAARAAYRGNRRHVLGHVGEPAGDVYDDEPLTCARCDAPMRFVVRLEEGRDAATAMNFGGGCAFAFVCPVCFECGAFFWEQ